MQSLLEKRDEIINQNHTDIAQKDKQIAETTEKVVANKELRKAKGWKIRNFC